MSKTDVKAHTDGNVAGNQWPLIATETWQLNKLGTGDVPSHPLIPLGASFPNRTVSHTRHLKNSTLQTISEYMLVSTSAQGAGCAGLCGGNGTLCTAQVILPSAEVSLKLISCGIISSLRSIKGPVHICGQTDRPKLLFAHDAAAHSLNYFKEMLQKYHAEGTLNILCSSIILDIEHSVCSYIRRTEMEKTPQKFSLASVLISNPVLNLATGTFFSSMTHLCKWLIMWLMNIHVICWCL